MASETVVFLACAIRQCDVVETRSRTSFGFVDLSVNIWGHVDDRTRPAGVGTISGLVDPPRADA